MQPLDIQTITRLLFSKIRMLILCMLIGALLFGGIACFALPEKYTSRIFVYVSNLTGAAEEQSASYSNLSSAEWLVLTYTEILQNHVTLEQVRPLLSRDVTRQELAEMISITGIDNTAMMQFTVTADDPDFAAEVCNALAKVAPQVLQSVVGAGSVRAVGVARRGSRTAPNITHMALFGLLLGLVVAAGIVIVRYLTDNTVKTEAVLKERLDVPVLGIIPSFDYEDKGGKKRA